MDDAAGPLEGLRVLDLTQALAGPYCTMLLADLGADVVKVEPPTGDMTRYPGPFTAEDTERAYGGYFASINRNKRSIVLDLKDRADRDAFLALSRGADVVVENSRAGVMDRLGVGYETLAEDNPRIVYAAIRGFGDPRTGESPYVDWPAYDVVAQSMGGLVAATGFDEDRPVKAGPSVGDIFSAAMAAVGVLAAVHHSGRTGEGQFLDVAMYDAVLGLCEGVVYRHSYSGTVTRPTGNGHPQIAPFNVFPTADGHCAIAAPGDGPFRLLCELIGRPHLADDPRFEGFRERLGHRGELFEEIASWTKTRPTNDVVAALGGRIPCGPVNDAEAIYTDPHVAARGMLAELSQPDGSRPVTVAGCPIKLTKTPSGVRTRPPRLGEHTAEILAEAGIERPEVER